MVWLRQIYAIQHNKTKRIYIGCSQCPEFRVKAHLAALRSHRHSSSVMQKDFDEYGDDFSAYGLEIVPELRIPAAEGQDLGYFIPTLREIAWMERFDTIENGYNHQDKQAKSILRKVSHS